MEPRTQRAVASELADDEQTAANAAIDAAISAAANEISFAEALAGRGITTVVMDEEDRMVRRHPDGSIQL